MIKIFCSIFVLTFVFAATAQARVMEMFFDDLIEDADLIVIGKVDSLNFISGVKIAKFKVLQTLKGNSTEEIYFVAESTWTCDVSSAKVGEKALMFFDKYDDLSNFKINFHEKPNFKNYFENFTAADELYGIYGSGYGRQPIKKIKGKDYISVPTYQIKISKSLLNDKRDEWTLQDKYADLGVISNYIDYRLRNPRYDLFIDFVAESKNELKSSLGFFAAFEKIKNAFF